ncbi:MAG: YihA family ribosome biogenesis GTP-binding protein [Bacteroidia bacterium]|nr:YihA family ribosome biogenesis GTP-binding protein [Bacteroidia bacterium]
MQIKNAAFLKSSANVTGCPSPVKPEYAFIGRSNVGKSSLINMLVNKNGLAKTSGTPGKTQLINHFDINDAFWIVDLPGYGYAKVPKAIAATWDKMISDYLHQRPNLMCVFVLIDSRHEPQKNDLAFIQNLGEAGVPLCIIFTKADKQSKSKTSKNIKAFNQTLAQTWEELPTYFTTSAETKEGRAEILGFLEKYNAVFKKPA